MTKISIIAALGAVVIMPIFAAEPTTAERKTTTSVNYVTRQVNTKQPKIPAAGTNSNTLGTTVVTYTTTGEGQIGERGIYNGGTYSASEANKLVTANALNTSVTSIPTITTSKLTCANQADGCTLWTIDDQTVYGNN